MEKTIMEKTIRGFKKLSVLFLMLAFLSSCTHFGKSAHHLSAKKSYSKNETSSIYRGPSSFETKEKLDFKDLFSTNLTRKQKDFVCFTKNIQMDLKLEDLPQEEVESIYY